MAKSAKGTIERRSVKEGLCISSFEIVYKVKFNVLKGHIGSNQHFQADFSLAFSTSNPPHQKDLGNKFKKACLSHSNYCIPYVLVVDMCCFICPKLQITNFFSILNCCVTNYSQTHLLKIATLFFLWILQVGNSVIVQGGTLSLFTAGASGGQSQTLEVTLQLKTRFIKGLICMQSFD